MLRCHDASQADVPKGPLPAIAQERSVLETGIFTLARVENISRE